MNEMWLRLAAEAGIELSTAQEEALSRYLDLLAEANSRMNLTRITDRAAAELQHVADSLTLLKFLPQGMHRLADVGSGGGVPGIVLAIARPDARVTLIEATKKKANFLRECVEKLLLQNVIILAERVEDVGMNIDYREQFDVVTCRAVATMEWLIEWCVPLLARNGKFLAMKGPKVQEELPNTRKALNLTGGGEPTSHAVTVPGMENHVIIEIPKLRKSDPQVPRSATRAKGKPIS